MFRAVRNALASSLGRGGRNAGAIRRAVDNTVESLESRRLYSVTAVSAGGVLTVTGDNGANAITVSRDVAGNLLVNGGAVAIAGPAATTANTKEIDVFGLGGNDKISLDETNGVLPAAKLSGGAGDDVLTGGSGADTLNGDDGNDLLLGKGGADQLFGGIGNDTLIGGTGADKAFGQAGDDLMIWNPGEGSDVNEGGDGNDTVEVNGGDASESFTADAVGTRVLFRRVNPGPFSIDIGTSENLVLNANGGDDTFTGGKGLAGLMKFTVNGGAGNDTLLGTDGADTLNGGDGNDFIDGNGGADVATLGAGDDTFQWDPGDGSDVVDGQGGNDRMVFNGNAANENVDLSANHGRLLFTRDVGKITMDVGGVEDVQFNALGGADTVTVHDLRRTGVTQVDLNLAGPTGKPDGQVDNVFVEGTPGKDVVTVDGSAGGDVSVKGLATAVTMRGADATDRLTVETLSGNDVVNASGLGAGAIQFTADGGRGNDVLVGGQGDDTLLGGNGRDILIGGPGTDHLDGGRGFDIVHQ